MGHLGSFGAARREFEPPAEPDTFDVCGETFTVVGEIPAMVELTLSAALGGKVSGLDGDSALYEALRHALTVPEHDVDGKTVPADASEWERYRKVTIAHRLEDGWLTALALNIMSAQAGRPTVRRSTSSDGPSRTGTSSNSSSSDSPDAPDLRPVDEVLGG
jgi:hypothetical protein